MTRLNNGSSSSNLLNRHASSQNYLNQNQLGMDAAIGSISQQAADPTALAAMTLGSFAFRATRLITLEGFAASGLTRIAPRFLLNAGASSAALLGEVSVFRAANNTLGSLAGHAPQQGVFNHDGFLGTVTDFATLKLLGPLGHHNAILGNAAQSFAMVAGHELSAEMGFTEHERGTLVEKLARAQVTNIAMGAGMSLMGTLTGGRFIAAERALDARIEAMSSHTTSPSLFETLGTRSPEIMSMGAQGDIAQNEATPSPGSRGPKKKSLKGRFFAGLRAAVNTAQKINMRPWVNVDQSFEAPRTEALRETPRSIEELFEQNWAHGLSRETLAHLRWGYANTHEAARPAYLELMREYMAYQGAIREKLDPILRKLPDMNLGDLNESAALAEQSAQRVAPSLAKMPETAYAVGLAYTVRETHRSLGLETQRNFERLSEVDLHRLGIDPDSVYAIARGPQAFEADEGMAIAHIAEHPALRETPEGRALQEAAQHFYETATRIRAETLAPDTEARRAQKSGLTREYLQAIENLRIATQTFLFENGNPENISWRARVVQVEQSRLATYSEALQGMRASAVADTVRVNLENIPAELRSTTQQLIDAATMMEVLQKRNPLSEIGHGLLRFFNKDSNDPMVIRGQYETALSTLLQHLNVNQLERLLAHHESAVNRDAVQETQTHFEKYTRQSLERIRSLRKEFAALERDNNEFWHEMDRRSELISIQNLRFELLQVRSFMEAQNRSLPDAYLTARGEAEAAIQEYVTKVEQKNANGHTSPLNGNGNGKISEYDLNRILREASAKIAEVRKVASRNLGEDNPIPVVSPLMQPVSEKMAARHWNRETIGALWQRARLTLFPVFSIMARAGREESLAAINWTLLHWARRLSRKTGSSYVAAPNVDHIASTQRAVVSFAHISWWDFLPFIMLAHASQKQRATHLDIPRIAAKADLGETMTKNGLGVIADTVELVTENINGEVWSYDASVTHLARTMAYGEIPGKASKLDEADGKESPREVSPDAPHDAALFPQLFMPVEALVTPFGFNLFPGASRLTAPMQGGRDFKIAKRYAALTARPAWAILGSSLGVYSQSAPKPDAPIITRKGSTRVVTQMLPMGALTETRRDAEPAEQTSRTNWWRTLIYNMSVTHRADPIASLHRTFAPYEKPLDDAAEATLAQMFGGIYGLYPNAEGVQHLNRRVETLRARLESLRSTTVVLETRAGDSEKEIRRTETELNQAERALANYQVELLSLSFAKAQQALQNADSNAASKKDVAEVRRLLNEREHLMQKVSMGIALSKGEQQTWEVLRNTHSTSAEIHGVAETLNHFIQFTDRLQRTLAVSSQLAEGQLLHGFNAASIAAIRTNAQGVQKLLKSRAAQLQVALARLNIGEALSPAESLLIENIKASLMIEAGAHRDSLLTELLKTDVNAADLRSVLEDEAIREQTRARVRSLPGAGRGTIDYVSERAEDPARVMMNAAMEAIEGPKSLWSTASTLSRFVLGGGFIAAVSMIDLATNNYFNFFTNYSSQAAKFIMAGNSWRPQIDPASIRVLEEAQIRSIREKRPLAFASGHTSWLDITTITALSPFSRYTAKKSLFYIPLVNLLLIGGRHTPISRGDSEKAKKQMAKAGRNMLKFGTATVNFHGGTRSITGSNAPAKKGTANLAIDTNAIVVALSLQGPDQVMPTGSDLFTKGLGTHRRVGVKLANVDYTPTGERKADVQNITDQTQAELNHLYMSSLQELHDTARAGNIMVQAQLNSRMARFEEGMNLVRAGRLDEARIWAEGTGEELPRNIIFKTIFGPKIEAGIKTDYNLLFEITHWWDSVHPTRPSSPQ